MKWMPATMRWGLRSAAAGAVLTALGVLATGPACRPASAPVRQARRIDASPNQWTLEVDGWLLAVGRTTPGAFAGGGRSGPQATGARLSPFDPLIHRHASAQGLDWRLVAAVIFEESRFRPDRRSAAGAYGLMQVRPIAARAVGAEDFKAPDDNIRTGVRYLDKLKRRFARPAGRDRLALVLAAYHMGPSHVRDAQAVARHLGYDPNRWENSMDLVLPLLEDPDYYTALPHGYAQGELTVQYVNRVLARYEHYKARAGETPAGLAAPLNQAASANG